MRRRWPIGTVAVVGAATRVAGELFISARQGLTARRGVEGVVAQPFNPV
jgi:hypothetical protein